MNANVSSDCDVCKASKIEPEALKEGTKKTRSTSRTNGTKKPAKAHATVAVHSAAAPTGTDEVGRAARAGDANGTLEAADTSSGTAPESDDAEVNMDVILDVPVTLAMEVGRTRLSIRNLLQLNQGSVVELDRAAGEPLDVFVNGTLVAHGEVVVVNEKFGIRLTDVISPAERVRKLK